MTSPNQLDVGHNGKAIKQSIEGALRCAMDAHGDLSYEHLGSASKRIFGALKTLSREQRSREQTKLGEYTEVGGGPSAAVLNAYNDIDKEKRKRR